MKYSKHGETFYIIRNAVAAVLVSAAALVAAYCIIGMSNDRREAENLRIVEQGVRRAAAECYAAEGFYPQSLDYLVENYNLSWDKNECIVHYSPITSNIMPDIRVAAK